MNRFVLVTSLICVSGGALAASCNELSSAADITASEPALQRASTDTVQQVRNEALRHAAATHDIASLEELLRQWTFDDLKLVAVIAAHHGYCAANASRKLEAIFMDRRIYQDRSQDRAEKIHGAAFWQALKDGHFDTAHEINIFVDDLHWESLASLSLKTYGAIDHKPITPDDICCYLKYMLHVAEQAWWRQVQGMSHLDLRRELCDDLKRVFERTIVYFSRGSNVAKILRSHCISLYLLLCPGSELFMRDDRTRRHDEALAGVIYRIRGIRVTTSSMHKEAQSRLRDDAPARLLHRLRIVSQRIGNPDLMGIICDYIDLENSNWLKLLCEYNMAIEA